MNLLTPAQCSISMLDHIFILVSQVRCLNHFPLESGCEDYSFLDQAVEDIEDGLDSILTDHINTS